MMRRGWGVAVGALVLMSSLSACVPVVVAGAGAAAMVGTDRRTTGSYTDDQTFEVKLAGQIADKVPGVHVNVTSFNRAVLLTGEVPDDNARAQVDFLARAQPGVRKLYNYVVIAPNSTLGNRLNDSGLSTKVRTRLLQNKNFSSNHIKVVTERGEVYLLGLVSEAEGQEAAQLASETSGVLKVVTLYEYLDQAR